MDRFVAVLEVGRCAGGMVKLAFDVTVSPPRRVAIKPAISRAHATREASFLRRCAGHEHIVQLQEVITDDRTRSYALVLDYCDAGTAWRLAQRATHAQRLQFVVVVLDAVLRGLAFLHGAGILHRDVKAANMLCATDGSVRLADLGLAKEAGAPEPEHPAPAVVGSPAWMAPEVVRGQSCSPAADIWAVGITAIEIVDGESPWAGSHPFDALLIAAVEHSAPCFRDPDCIPSELVSFVALCCSHDPTKRPTAVSLLEHNLFYRFRSHLAGTKDLICALKHLADSHRIASSHVSQLRQVLGRDSAGHGAQGVELREERFLRTPNQSLPLIGPREHEESSDSDASNSSIVIHEEQP